MAACPRSRSGVGQDVAPGSGLQNPQSPHSARQHPPLSGSGTLSPPPVPPAVSPRHLPGQGPWVLSQVCHLPDHRVRPSGDGVDSSPRMGFVRRAARPVCDPAPRTLPGGQAGRSAPANWRGQDFSSRRSKGQVCCSSASRRPEAPSRSAGPRPGQPASRSSGRPHSGVLPSTRDRSYIGL